MPEYLKRRSWGSENSTVIFRGNMPPGPPTMLGAAGAKPLVLLRIWLLDIAEPPPVTSVKK